MKHESRNGYSPDENPAQEVNFHGGSPVLQRPLMGPAVFAAFGAGRHWGALPAVPQEEPFKKKAGPEGPAFAFQLMQKR